ncbi:uncharacterized protein LOC144154764 isoform X1 [Haemaphysalis longicornis]
MPKKRHGSARWWHLWMREPSTNPYPGGRAAPGHPIPEPHAAKPHYRQLARAVIWGDLELPNKTRTICYVWQRPITSAAAPMWWECTRQARLQYANFKGHGRAGGGFQPVSRSTPLA